MKKGQDDVTAGIPWEQGRSSRKTAEITLLLVTPLKAVLSEECKPPPQLYHV